MTSTNFLILAFFIPTALNFVPPTSEGDYRQIYPTVCIGIAAHNNEHVLPYFMGLVEELRYPKDRIHLLFITDDEDRKPISRWVEQFPRNIYRSTSMKTNAVNWREEALAFGRRKSCAYAFIMDTNGFFMRDSLRELISLQKLVVSPLLISPNGGQSNAHGLLDEDFVNRKQLNLIRVYYSSGPLLIHLKHTDSAYLTFDENNLQSAQVGDPIHIFAHSAYVMNISIFFSNQHHYGYFIGGEHSKIEQMSIFGTFLANWVSNVGPMPFPVSAVLPPWYPVPVKFGFNQVYLINLRRRPERLVKMQEVLRLVGMDFVRFDAVDGQNLTNQELRALKFLPGYQDPYHKRPMKLGEIGCFLSHFKVWEDIVRNGHQQAIVLEDDVRFAENGTLILNRLVEDLLKTRLQWDFIYLGRKRMVSPSDEIFVPGHRFLSTVGYSYWTLGYAISTQGAQKLLAARPLDRLLALDEFLPVMYNRHPNAKWSAHFEPRDLRAFASYPPIVEPERYTHQQGYVSDTEGSRLVEETAPELQDKHLLLPLVEDGGGSAAKNVKDEF